MSLTEIVKKDYIDNDQTLCFQTTSVAKVLILSIITSGTYGIILAYSYWKSLKNNFGYKVSPFWRAIFMGLTNFRLFKIFEKYFKNFNEKLPCATLIAGLYLLFEVVGNKLSFMTIDTTNWAIESIIWFLVILNALILAFIQNKINKINETYFPNAPKNPWKISNTIWVIVFILLLILAYLPE